MQKKPLRATSFVRKIEQMTFVRAVRGGLVNMIPVLIIGAFALVFRFLPIDGYREFIESFAGGVFDKIFLYVNAATFGVLSIYMTYSISRSYMKVKADPETVNGGAVFASLVAFFILSGAFKKINAKATFKVPKAKKKEYAKFLPKKGTKTVKVK